MDTTIRETSIISAWTDRDRIIGLSTMGEHGGIPWDIPEDMAQYKELTKDATMIMGRDTFLSIPPKFRPLVGRENFVVSSTLTYQHLSEKDSSIIIVSSVAEALSKATRSKIFFNGGQGIYEEGLKYADTIYATIVLYEGEGDRFFPKLGDEWKRIEDKTEHTFTASKNGTPYQFATFKKVSIATT